MKKIINYMVLAGIVVAMHSCSKDNSTSSAAAASGYMKATINRDSAFSVSGASGAYAGLVSYGGLNTVTIYGITAWNKTIEINLVNVTVPGTYSFATATASANYTPNSNSGSAYTYAQAGFVTITQLSPTLVGTFNFTCTDNTQVSGGSFSVPSPQ